MGADRGSGAGVAPEVGNSFSWSEIPLGTVIHNIELYGQEPRWLAPPVLTPSCWLVRGKFAIIKLPSGETRMVLP